MSKSFKLSSKKYAILILILFLSFTFLAVSKVKAVGTTFMDDFEGTTVDHEKWIIQENTNMSGYPASGGSVKVLDSQIFLSSTGSGFPCITSAVNPFPTTGDFSVEFNFTYTCISDWGNGLWISDGPFIGKEEEASSNVIFHLWADNDGFDKVSIRVRLLDDLIYFSEIYGWEPSAPTHTFRLEYFKGVYTVFIDRLEAGSTSSQVRPDSIGFGHPPTYYIPFSPDHVNRVIGGWGSFAIDYIRVTNTVQTDGAISDKNSAQISFYTDAKNLEIGFVVAVSGILTNQEGEPLRDETVVLSYSVLGTKTWYPIASATTDFNGFYSASWIPTATGRFALKAEWVGNETYWGAYDVKNISVSSYESKSLFFAESNSSLSSLVFNSTSRAVSFTVSGPSGTTGYVRFLISKTIGEDFGDFEVYLDGQQVKFNATSVGSFHLLYFKYPHSSHYITIKLPACAESEPLFTTILLAVAVAILPIATVIIGLLVYFKKRKR